MQKSLNKLTELTSLTVLKIAPGKDKLCFDFFEKSFLVPHSSIVLKRRTFILVKFPPWMLILLLLIGTSSVSSDFGDSRTFILSLCFIIILFEFDFRDSNSIYGFLYDALCVNISFILCFLLMFYSESQENEFGSLKWRKTLKLTHACDEKCILLLNI